MEFEFVRLSAVSVEQILAHMSDARLVAHMPLLEGMHWDRSVAEGFVAAKEAAWVRDGLGVWAILQQGRYVGWGGFQREGANWDYALVLRPEAFGLGLRITRQALAWARAEGRMESVTFLLPPTRRHLGALARIGAVAEDEVSYLGARFLKFRLRL
ncbi:GNAT family N-acetyltransferase [Arenibacterium sp. LLYu02]|uniref:GNAT family N-acetyltransferase n=1 Tax=Arenibacterium sp. LLYu02 TaxID=3404132 RepID=UPI003B223CB6